VLVAALLIPTVWIVFYLLAPFAVHRSKGVPTNQQLAADALANVQRTGQKITNRAYPVAIGGVTYNNAKVQDIITDGDDYVATVRINYSNAFGLTNFLDIRVTYDSRGTFRSWRLGEFNSPFPPSIRDKTFDRWLD
jgi:hypothetical protein